VRYLVHLLTAPTKEKFDKTIDEILNKLEYKHLREYRDVMERLTQKIASWIEEWIKSMNLHQREITEAVPSISNAVIIAGSIIIVLIVIFFILYMKKMVRKDKKAIKILGEVIDDRTTKEGLNEKARRCKEAGEYREAIRYSFIALLLQMNEKNLLYLDEAQTNSEIVSTLKKNNFKHMGLFENTTELFNKVWYGHKIINGEIYEAWENMLTLLENGVYGIEDKR